MSRDTEVGLDPCRAEGGCVLLPECRVKALDCLSFRMYVAGKPRIGVDVAACKREKGYHFHSDRGLKRKRLKEYAGLLGPWKES